MQQLLIIALFIIVGLSGSYAQTQVVKGTVVDAQAEFPIIGASVILLNSDPIIGAVTDLEG